LLDNCLGLQFSREDGIFWLLAAGVIGGMLQNRCGWRLSCDAVRRTDMDVFLDLR
jgi:hypothetical protein